MSSPFLKPSSKSLIAEFIVPANLGNTVIMATAASLNPIAPPCAASRTAAAISPPTSPADALNTEANIVVPVITLS